MFDAEAFTTRCRDVAMFQTKDMQSFYFAIEDGFKLFEEQANS